MNRIFVLLLSGLLSSISFTAGAQDAELPLSLLVTDPAERKAQAIALLSRYLQFESISGHEYEAGEFLAEFCREQGLYVTQLPAASGSMNFAATLYPLSEEKPVIWLQHHMDVVPAPIDSEWRYPPFSGAVVQDTIWGRGTIDNKGQGIMQLMALLNLKELADTTEFIYNTGILCLSNEERSGNLGARLVLDEAYEKLNPLVVFGEGGAGLVGVLERKPAKPVFGISVAEKEALWLKLQLELKSFGHGAAPAPEYANKLMIHALSRLESRDLDLDFNRVNKRMFRRLGRAEGGIRGFIISRIYWWGFRPFVKGFIEGDPMLEALTTNTVTVTKLENPPGPPNKISAISTAYLDCRLQPGTTAKAFIRKLERLLDEPKIDIEVINTSAEVKPSPVNDFYEALEYAIKEEVPEAAVVPILFPATTDNTSFRLYDIPTYGLVPAVMDEELIKSVHTINERLPVVGLVQGINIYTTMLQRLQEEGAQKRRRLLHLEFTKSNLQED